jgi:hypothetical protein
MTEEQREIEMSTALESIHKGANWFYWIVGLSLVNLVLAFAKSDTHFIIGLAMSELASGFIVGDDAGAAFMGFGAIMLVVILGLFVFIGKKAHKPHKGLFLAGIILYLADGLIYLAFSDFLPAAFHGYVIFNLWMGYKAIGPYMVAFNEPITPAEEESIAAASEVPEMATVSSLEEAAPRQEEDPYKPIV